MTPVQPYTPIYPIRLVTAASLFDGHDAAINIMRRILQASGAEIIHLGHNRSVAEIVTCAIQEDVQGIAVTSYQGGHVEFFKYMYDLLQQQGAGHIRIFGGGGGTILPSEADELHQYGITRIYSPDDGRAMGLQGMINDVLEKCDFSTFRQKKKVALANGEDEETEEPSRLDEVDYLSQQLPQKDPLVIGRLITIAENHPASFPPLPIEKDAEKKSAVLGITGTGGAGKSSMVDELVRRFLMDFSDKTVAIISVDPSKRKTGGALLGDRIRMNAIFNPRIYMRSLATRQSNLALSKYVQDAIRVCKAAQYDLIIVETSGIGQSDTEIVDHVDKSLYIMTSDYGAATQLEKIDMLDFADVIAINKFDKRGSLDALRDVRKQYKRNHNLWDTPDHELPIFGTIASQFNDAGTTALYQKVMETLIPPQPHPNREGLSAMTLKAPPYLGGVGAGLMPPDRVRYLAEIVESSRLYETFVTEQSQIARQLYQLQGSIALLRSADKNVCLGIEDFQYVLDYQSSDSPVVIGLIDAYRKLERKLHHECRQLLADWKNVVQRYRADKYQYQVRDKVFEQDLFTETLSHLKIPKVSLPRYQDWGDLLTWLLTENVPGEFPFASGVFPLKREGEDPTRMFAGEGGPERTNRRFHYLSKGMAAKRLSTAFDSVTLYGENPDRRPDIYGKIGMSGVSICTLDDAKKLYSGFDLCHPATSVSMTINGPAPMLLGFFLNAAIDQQCEIYIRKEGKMEEVEQKIQQIFKAKGLVRPTYQRANEKNLSPQKATQTGVLGQALEWGERLGEALLGVSGADVLPLEVYEKIKADTLTKVRGTVQADILKEDQAQNTCIFSSEFALRMMGDIQQYFIDNRIQNFYSVSISGYHIAEAGANPISQLAFTLSNGFTFVEYYLSRGMHIDDFAPNLSFFFSNGMDPEYSVLGRVARRIWAKAMKYKYKGNSRSQRLKYHIQTSGRSLHAQEIAFNDIRTTLQALCAIYDNCNSLHTNAYDEAITTPTEESVRRAMAIQLIINKEWGLSANENPLQGSFIIEELTDMVENAVYQEFLRINDRGGVLGAMETMYQRSRIQEESLYYETLKHDGKLPIVGVNTFLGPQGSPTVLPTEVFRSSTEEKDYAIASKDAFEAVHQEKAQASLQMLQQVALQNGNIFEALMDVCQHCSLGQISKALYEVGGQYRRNM